MQISKNVLAQARLQKEKENLSIAFEKKKAINFWTAYLNECAKGDQCPLLKIQKNAERGILDINCDRIWAEEWPCLLKAIAYSNNIESIHFHSIWRNKTKGEKSSDQPAVGEHYSVIYNHSRKTQKPFIQNSDYSFNLVRSLSLCFRYSPALTSLSLTGICFSIDALKLLGASIPHAISLKKLDMSDTPLKDEGLKAIAPGLRRSCTIAVLDISSCLLTEDSHETLGAIVKGQIVNRQLEKWKDSLRYREAILENQAGLRRMTLCCNPLLGDRGISDISEALQDDLWLKALDFQHCGISGKGVKKILSHVKHNTTIKIIDVRNNNVEEKLMGALYVQLNINNEYPAPLPYVQMETNPSCIFKWLDLILVNAAVHRKSSGDKPCKARQRLQSASAELRSMKRSQKLHGKGTSGRDVLTPVFVPSSTFISGPLVPGTRFVRTEKKVPKSVLRNVSAKSFVSKDRPKSAPAKSGKNSQNEQKQTHGIRVSAYRKSKGKSKGIKKKKAGVATTSQADEDQNLTFVVESIQKKKSCRSEVSSLDKRIDSLEKRNKILKKVLNELKNSHKGKEKNISKSLTKKRGSTEERSDKRQNKQSSTKRKESNLKSLLQKEQLFSLIEATFEEFNTFVDDLQN